MMLRFVGLCLIVPTRLNTDVVVSVPVQLKCCVGWAVSVLAVFPIPYSTDLMGSAPVQEHRCIGWAMAVLAVSPILEVGVGGNVVDDVPHGNHLDIVTEAVHSPNVDHGIDRRVDDVPHGESRGVVKEVVHVAIVGRGNDHRVDEVPHGRSHGVGLPGVVLISQVRVGHRVGPGVR